MTPISVKKLSKGPNIGKGEKSLAVAGMIGLTASEAYERYSRDGVEFTDTSGPIRRPVDLPSTTIGSHVQKDRKIGNRPARDHTGIDLSVVSGTPVLSIAAGTVAFAGEWGGCGYTVIINHPSVPLGAEYVLIQTTSCHLSRIDVQKGSSVSAGQQIGLSGGARNAVGAGNSTGPHLHLQIKTKDADGGDVSLTDKGPYGVYFSIVAPKEAEAEEAETTEIETPSEPLNGDANPDGSGTLWLNGEWVTKEEYGSHEIDLGKNDETVDP